jgi:Ca2+-binding RTX toxin-like protein
VFTGTSKADKWTGTSQADTAFGKGGNDSLSGAAGNDVIDGGDGNDRLVGGKGSDNLTGGKGLDTFVFLKGDSKGDVGEADFIEDLGKGDKINLSAISKTFNLIKTLADDVDGSNLRLSASRRDIFVADVDGDHYLVYETAANGSAVGHEIIALGTEITAVNTWALKLGVLTV